LLQDILTGDEIISDSFDLKEIDGVAYEADGRPITVGGETFNTGANASAEGGDDEIEDTSEKVIDFVYTFRLQSTSFDKKSYLTYLKSEFLRQGCQAYSYDYSQTEPPFPAYMKKVKEALKEKGSSDEEIKDFETKAGAFAKKIIGSFKDYEFYIGESMDPDGMVVLLNYREDGVTPFMTVWKHGLTEMKV
jgi:hypothetical protein